MTILAFSKDYIYTHIHIYIYIYIRVYMCVVVPIESFAIRAFFCGLVISFWLMFRWDFYFVVCMYV